MLKILKYPDAVLKKKAQKVATVDRQIKNLALDMIETMNKVGGVGLAAPQIGVSQRIIAVKNEDEDWVIINPEIIKKSWRKETSTEGCLSLPGVEVKVKRHHKITVKGLNYSGESIIIEAKGLLARIFQHEIDHLNGVLIIDK